MASFVPRVGDEGVGKPGLWRFSTEPTGVHGRDMGTVSLVVTMLGGPGYTPHEGDEVSVDIHWMLFPPNDLDRNKDAEDGTLIFTHGVPTSSEQWAPVANMTSKYTGWSVAIDTPGMGRSSDPPHWDYTFKNDAALIKEFSSFLQRSEHFPGEPTKFHVYGDDWGGGAAVTFFTLYPEMCNLGTAQNPISFDGWPVGEIETIGRLMVLIVAIDEGDRDAEAQLLGEWMSFPETFVQILKTMVVNERAWNAFSLRKIRGPYELTHYRGGGSTIESLMKGKKLGTGYGPAWKPDPGLVTEGSPDYDPELAQKFKNWKALIKRASWLDPRQLTELDYSRINFPINIVWGQKDNMMPASQAWWFKLIVTNGQVLVTRIPDAGHFANLDQPGLVADALLNFITAFDPRRMGALIRPYAGELSVITAEFLEYYYSPSNPLAINDPLHTRGLAPPPTFEPPTPTSFTSGVTRTMIIAALGSDDRRSGRDSGTKKKHAVPLPRATSRTVAAEKKREKEETVDDLVAKINGSRD